MGGKAAILMVLGFSLIFLVVGHNFGSLSTRSVDNFTDYYRETMAHNIAVSAANMAANQLFFDNKWKDGYSDVDYQDGSFDVNITGNLDDIKIEAIGRYEGISRRVEIELRPSSFAKYGYFVNIFPSNLVLFTGDTIWGPFHSQQKLNTMGSPVFMGKATAKNGLYMRNPKDPKFYGGFESGVDVPLEWDASLMENAAAIGGFNIADSAKDNFTDVRVIFNSDATLTYQFKYDKDKDDNYEWETDTYTYPLSQLTSNGVIYLDKGNIYMSGTIAGKYTVGVNGSSSEQSFGNIFLEDDVVYRTDPLKDNNCQDMLGIVAKNNVSVLKTTPNMSDINIHATLFNYSGGLSVNGLSSTDADMGRMNVIGGVIEYKSQITGYTNGAGYSQSIKYDPRLMLEVPPYFPATRNYEIVSWYE